MPERIEVATLGEALIVMDPLDRSALRHVETFAKRIGGAELNVAVALSRLGHHAGWSGRLGGDEFGHEILAFLRAEGVDASRVHLDPDAPTGMYFKERRALDSMRAHYYRAGSAASRHRFEDLDPGYLLSGQILHLTGITPALSESCRNLCERIVSLAVERGALVSFDVNVRWRLFGNRDPREILAPLYSRADLVFLSDEEANSLLGDSSPASVQRAVEGWRAKTVVVHSAEEAFAVASSSSEIVHAPAHAVEAVDTVGAGDAFVAGFLSGSLRDWSVEGCLRLANACGACAVTVPGDARGMPFEEDALSLVGGPSTVER